ncbi:hypothetical protein [Brevundimonas sp.]|uniref:hypothetical protein n=1 Tax=Brevundimonas sp. TaxID=1871086 RepID=UPI0025ECB995|nr:hypothetical protein [Brevundimonas sp.]
MADEDVILDDSDDDMEIVHWYEPEPMSLSLAQASGAVVTAFALGVLTAVGVLALTGRIRD